jgi:hypothetical protein
MDSESMIMIRMYGQPMDNGLALVELARSMRPEDLKTRWWLLIAYEECGRHENVVEVASSLLGQPKPPAEPNPGYIDHLIAGGDGRLLMKRAGAFRAMKKPYRALSDLNRCISLDTANFEPYGMKYKIIQDDLRMPNAADGVIDSYMKAIGKKKIDFNGRWTDDYCEVVRQFMEY